MGSDKSLTEGGDQIRSRVDLEHPLWGISPSLSPQHVFGSSRWILVDASVNRLGCQSDQPPDWQLHSVRLRSGLARHRSGIDGHSFNWFDVSPWDLRPPWAGSPGFCINQAQVASSKLVRTGIEVLLLLYCCNSSFEINKIFGSNTVWCHYMCGWLLPLFYWGNLYLWSFFANFL